ncbi:hypothetical protein P8C59_004229 [Phyllachora maydis]|uniref:MMS19 nucleotide excision repair protein n=1 Tax=Phyllachora maydis TaxID=1825666 RepID=A0AAD9I2C6_9PEZI|nr:hypothetical protein P8C59_004229 [Phyllachora maydis]
MVDFQALARQYVAEESEQVRDQLALSASSAISEAHAGTTAVGNWASSIQQWITVADDGVVDVDSRTKALRFLAHTLEHLNPRLLRDFQVQFLCTFFGSMFSVDPRAGIAPSTRALWSLCRMRNYSPAMGAQIVSQVLLLGDDFSKQPTPARWEVYELLLRLFEDDRVLGELEHVFGPSAGCIVDLIRLYVDEELFRAFSNYFPISLNNKISSTAVTTTELKVALRACFSAHQRLASLAFPFLLGKLDISEPASREVDNVSTKVDILQTIQAKAYGTAQSVAQKTDALSLLQLFLRGRQSLLKKDEPRDVAARVLALSEVAFRLEDIWTEDLAPLLSDAPWDTSSDVLGQVLRTAALLASQQSLTETGAAVQSCSRSTYDAMIKVLGSHLFTNRENGHSVMEGLYAPDGKALSFICDAQVFETIPQGVAAARAAVGSTSAVLRAQLRWHCTSLPVPWLVRTTTSCN